MIQVAYLAQASKSTHRQAPFCCLVDCSQLKRQHVWNQVAFLQCTDEIFSVAHMNDLWLFYPQDGMWRWIGGSNDTNRRSNYEIGNMSMGGRSSHTMLLDEKRQSLLIFGGSDKLDGVTGTKLHLISCNCYLISFLILLKRIGMICGTIRLRCVVPGKHCPMASIAHHARPGPISTMQPCNVDHAQPVLIQVSPIVNSCVTSVRHPRSTSRL